MLKIWDWIRQWFKREKPVVIPQPDPLPPACGCSMKWIKGKKIPDEGEVKMLHGVDCRALGVGADGKDWFLSNTVYDNRFCTIEPTLAGMTFHAKCFTHPTTGQRYHYAYYKQPSSEGQKIEMNDIEIPRKSTFRVYYKLCEA